MSGWLDGRSVRFVILLAASVASAVLCVVLAFTTGPLWLLAVLVVPGYWLFMATRD